MFRRHGIGASALAATLAFAPFINPVASSLAPALRQQPSRRAATPAWSTSDAGNDSGAVAPASALDTTPSTGGFSLAVNQVPDLKLALRRTGYRGQ